jgi:hypothetical protein
MRYLTKSKFKQGLDCPTKLFYLDKSKNYANSMLDDPFLKALAEGGFQVGELAKFYYPHGVNIESLNYDESELETKTLLSQKSVTIYEAAIKFENLFVRVDILKKHENTIDLIEVKSKSFNPTTFEDEIWDKRELKKNNYKLKEDWFSYLYDLAFQAYVFKKAYPEYTLNSYLMCADKTKTATVDGLNQKFRIRKDNTKSSQKIIVNVKNLEELGDPVLTAINVNHIIDKIHNNLELKLLTLHEKKFEDVINYFSNSYNNDQKLKPKISEKCKSCEYRAKEDGKKWGFGECLIEAKGLTLDELNEQLVFDIWRLQPKRLLDNNKLHVDEIDETDLNIRSRDDGSGGLSSSERQWLQINKIQNKDQSPYIDYEGLNLVFSQFKYPLNLIDFETTTTAIPFYKGQRPFEQVAFQFSHHLLHVDGTIEHVGEFLSTKPGAFPNFEFLRALKKSLSQNEGSIFRYSHHENTVLNQIYNQLENSSEPDKLELQNFIRTITTYSPDGETKISGQRSMIDLCDLVIRYYYSPLMGKSNSIKYVLPAILNESKKVKEKYNKPIYSSKNYPNPIAWVEMDSEGKVKDPYLLLPPIFNDEFLNQKMNLLSSEDDDLRNGGAAMTAFALTQFCEMSDEERKAIHQALLRYCELDTLAMCMILEYWKECLINANKLKAA